MEMKTLPLPKVGIRLLSECKRESLWLAAWIAMMAMAALLRVEYTQLLGQAGDAVLAGGTDFFARNLGAMIAVAVGSIASSMAISYLSGKYKTLTTARLTARTVRSLNGARYGWLQHQKSGDLLQRANTDTTLAADLINGWLPDTINAFLQVLLAAYFIVSVDWRLALTYFGMFPIAVIGQAWVSKPIEKTRLAAQNAMAQAKALASDTLHRVDAVKAYSLEDVMAQRARVRMEHFSKLDKISNRAYCATVPVGFICAFLPSLALYAVSIALVINGSVTVGQLMAMVSLTTTVDSVLIGLGQYLANVRTQSAGSQRIFELWDAPQERMAGTLPRLENHEALRIEHVTFGYSGSDPIIQDMCLSIKPGERVAVVGASGSGKSTLLKLVAGLYNPQAGRILVEGRDGAKMDVNTLRGHMSYMAQDSHIFQGTLRENVAFGRKDAYDQEIIKALEDAGLDEWLEMLPKGLDSTLGDMGSALSGGQRQRIAMARCMLHDAPLFLLDEATSALDNQTEREVLETLDRQLEDKTALLVTHRLSALRGITRVVVMDQGRIVEDGTPQELMEKKGHYYHLLHQQEDA